jgi:carbon storage regulator
MLILSRKPGERIVINDNIVITVIDNTRHRVRIGIEAQKDTIVHREEIWNKINKDVNSGKQDISS